MLTVPSAFTIGFDLGVRFADDILLFTNLKQESRRGSAHCGTWCRPNRHPSTQQTRTKNTAFPHADCGQNRLEVRAHGVLTVVSTCASALTAVSALRRTGSLVAAPGGSSALFGEPRARGHCAHAHDCSSPSRRWRPEAQTSCASSRSAGLGARHFSFSSALRARSVRHCPSPPALVACTRRSHCLAGHWLSDSWNQNAHQPDICKTWFKRVPEVRSCRSGW